MVSSNSAAIISMLATAEENQRRQKINEKTNIQEMFGVLCRLNYLGGDNFSFQYDRSTELRIGYAELRLLAEFYGTEQVSTEDYDKSGCDTCGYGSEESTTVYVSGVTKNWPAPLFSWKVKEVLCSYAGPKKPSAGAGFVFFDPENGPRVQVQLPDGTITVGKLLSILP